MYLTVRMSGTTDLIAQVIDAEDLEDDEQCIANIQTYVNEGNLVVLTDTLETLKYFFPGSHIEEVVD